MLTVIPLSRYTVSMPSKPDKPVLGQAPRRKPSAEAVRRSVASSTAIETGQSVAELESKLRQPSRRFSHITLAR